MQDGFFLRAIAIASEIGKIALAIKIHFGPTKMIFSVMPTHKGIWFGMQNMVNKRVAIESKPAKIVIIILFFFIMLQ